MLLDAYINCTVLNYNDLVWECGKLRSENQNLQALKQENEALRQKVEKLHEFAAYALRNNK